MPVTTNVPALDFTTVNNYVQAAHDGDTLILPPGIGDWGSTLTIPFNITFQGAGADLTNVTPDPARSTILKNNSTNGVMIIFATNDNVYSGNYYRARLTGLVFNAAKICSIDNGMVGIRGQSHGHLVGGVCQGGVRVDHNRWIADTQDIEKKTWFFGLNALATGNSHNTGSFDHNFVDYTNVKGTGEVFNISRRGTANNAFLPGGNSLLGQDDWNNPYTLGGDLSANGLYDAWFFEDNIFHKNGGFFDMLAGGCFAVYRWNNTWGAPGAHGAESGGNFGPRGVEYYNNHVINGASIGLTPPTYPTNVGRLRGGCWVSFNNRFTDCSATAPILDIQMYRIEMNATAWPFGCGDGTNAFDNNEKGTITKNGQTVNPVVTTPPLDARAGDIYLTGIINSMNATGSPVVMDITSVVTNPVGPPSGTFIGYALRDVVNGTNGSDLSQGLAYPDSRNLSYSVVTVDIKVSDTERTLTMAGAANLSIRTGMQVGNGCELRRVKFGFCVPGSGQVGKTSGWLLNGGNNHNSVQMLLTGTPTPSPNPQWSSQEALGLWEWDNRYRLSGSTFATIPPFTDQVNVKDFVPGGVHDWDGRTGAPIVPTGYPSRTLVKRVGADWNAPGWNETLYVPGGPLDDTDPSAPVTTYGGVYPNPYVTTAAATKIIRLSGAVTFGPVNIGTTAHQTLVVSNDGNTAFAVTGVTIKDTGGTTIAQYTPSPTTGTINPLATMNVDIAFAPTAATTYPGTITVVTEAGVTGTPTAAVTGTGTAVTTVVWAITGNLAFGTLQVGATVSRNVVFTNNGTVAGVITALPHDPGVFLSWTTRTINPGTSSTLIVTADTTTTGTFNGAINVTTQPGPTILGDDHINFGLIVTLRRIPAPFKR